MTEEITYPMRINRYLHIKGYCSRRAADKLIEEGKIQINGTDAKLGQRVEKTDDVTVADSVKALPSQYKYYIFNKPIGVVSHNPQKGEKSVENLSGLDKRFFPVGRLDKASSGLMLLTNDGRIVNKVLNPEFGHEREYIVTVDKNIKNKYINALKKGVYIEKYRTKTAKVEKIGEKSFTITLTEGKKHQIRRMCAALGFQVKSLKRTRMMHIELNDLAKGKTRELSKEESETLLNQLEVRLA